MGYFKEYKEYIEYLLPPFVKLFSATPLYQLIGILSGSESMKSLLMISCRNAITSRL